MDTGMCDYTVRFKTLSSAVNFYTNSVRELLKIFKFFFMLRVGWLLLIIFKSEPVEFYIYNPYNVLVLK